MLDEATVRRLFNEEAAKRGITLGAEHSVNWQVHESATEEEARQAISELLAAQMPTYLQEIQRVQARRDDLMANPNEGDPAWDEAWRQVCDELSTIHARISKL